MQTQASFRHPTLASTASVSGDPLVARLLARSRPCAISFYKANEVIYGQGEEAGPLYLVEFGTVRVCRLVPDGRRQVSAFHFAGEIFGFESGSEHQSFAESVDSTGVRVLRPSSGDGLGVGTLTLALRTLARAQDHLMLLGRMTAAEKMATFLLDLRDRQDADSLLDLPMSRGDIGDYLGLTFETVSRVLRSFREARLIRVPSVSQVEIVNLRALEAVTDGPH